MSLLYFFALSVVTWLLRVNYKTFFNKMLYCRARMRASTQKNFNWLFYSTHSIKVFVRNLFQKFISKKEGKCFFHTAVYWFWSLSLYCAVRYPFSHFEFFRSARSTTFYVFSSMSTPFFHFESSFFGKTILFASFWCQNTTKTLYKCEIYDINLQMHVAFVKFQIEVALNRVWQRWVYHQNFLALADVSSMQGFE